MKKIREEEASKSDQGSIIMVLATDIPLTEMQLSRTARRAEVGLVRTGSFVGHQSGDVVIAFTTANRHMRDDGTFRPMSAVHNNYMEVIFRAASEAVEEAILNSLTTADRVVSGSGKVLRSLNEFLPECL